MPPDIAKVIERNTQLKNDKAPWLPLYQALAMYCFLRKQYFTIDNLKSPFMFNNIYDSTAPHSANMLAASLVGQIMPNPFESFEFVPQVAQKEGTYDDSYDFFQTVNEVLPNVLALPEAGLMTALMECITDMGVFGIGGIAVEETGDFAIPIRYYSVDAKVMSVDENQYGQIDTVYMERELTVVKVVDKYGFDNCSDKIQKMYLGRQQLDERVKILHAIQPRMERNPLMLGTMDMPFTSLHIELDTKHLLKESGYKEMPIIVGRFSKNVNEVQGRSPAMSALPDIKAVNKLVEMFERAGEMGLDPPKTISAEDVLGAGKIPWGPGVDIPIRINSRLGTDKRPPIEILQTVQNPGWALQRIQSLQENIERYFMLQYLTDLNNTSRQTLGEADIRNEKGMYITGPILTRLLLELESPALDRSFNICLEQGRFGVVKGSVQDFRLQSMGIEPKYISDKFIAYRMNGQKGYRLNFISPAARLMKLEELQGNEQLVKSTGEIAQFKPNAWDVINEDELVRSNQRLGGASSKVLNSPDKVDQIRQARAQQHQQEQQMQAHMAAAATLKQAGSGVKDLANAATAA